MTRLQDGHRGNKYSLTVRWPVFSVQEGQMYTSEDTLVEEEKRSNEGLLISSAVCSLKLMHPKWYLCETVSKGKSVEDNVHTSRRIGHS